MFYDVLEMNKLNIQSNNRFELTQTQAGQQKRASKKALDLNGGNDEACLGFPPRSEISAFKPHGLVAPFLRYPD